MRAALLATLPLALVIGACATAVPAAGPTPASAAGVWNFSATMPTGHLRGMLWLTQEPDGLTGTVMLQDRRVPVETVVQAGPRLTVKFTDPYRGPSVIEARVRGNRLDGTLGSETFGVLRLDGTRRPT